MKNKYTAALLAFFFGWAGGHRFYLNQRGMGMMYLGATMIGWIIPPLAILRAIPFMLGLVDGVAFLFQSEEDFDRKYNPEVSEDGYRSTRRDRRRNRSRGRRRDDFFEPDYRQRKPSNARREKPVHKRERLKKTKVTKNNPFKLSGIRKFKEFDIKGAIEDFNRALGMNPKDISLHFNLACSYSLTENAERAFFHLNEAVSLGFNDFERIRTHESLAFLRIHADWDAFEENGYQLTKALDPPKEEPERPDDQLLTQLNKLSELRKKGLISEEEFVLEKEKLMK